MRALLFSFVLAGCSPTAMNVTTENPAHADAKAGRLAGPPSALRPGVAELADQPPAPASPAAEHPPGHQMPGAGASPAPMEGHTMPMPEPANPDKPGTKPPANKGRKPPAAKKPAQTEHEGHNMPAKSADKPAATGHEGHVMPAKPADKPASTGHEGHVMPEKPVEKPAKSTEKPAKPTEKKPAEKPPKKPAKPAEKPAPMGQEGHKMTAPPAGIDTPVGTIPMSPAGAHR